MGPYLALPALSPRGAHPPLEVLQSLHLRVHVQDLLAPELLDGGGYPPGVRDKGHPLFPAPPPLQLGALKLLAGRQDLRVQRLQGVPALRCTPQARAGGGGGQAPPLTPSPAPPPRAALP